VAQRKNFDNRSPLSIVMGKIILAPFPDMMHTLYWIKTLYVSHHSHYFAIN